MRQLGDHRMCFMKALCHDGKYLAFLLVSIVGKSGSEKAPLLHVLAGFMKPESGSIEVLQCMRTECKVSKALQKH